MDINWLEEIYTRKDDLLKDTCELLQIKSVLDESTAMEDAPFGVGINRALKYILHKGNEAGFLTKNIDGYAGHIQMGQGEEIVGVLCHIDVVPEGDGWTSDPYSAEIRENKIFARGAIDDKGPTMAAFYGMKIINELQLPLSKRVRLIVGTDEESQWRCVERYFQKEEMPSIGFAPDADFPIIHAEKGIVDFDFVFPQMNGNGAVQLLSFQSGLRYNMVPDSATAVVNTDNGDHIVELFHDFLQENQLQGEMNLEDRKVTMFLKGISAHGMEPDKGKNAGILLAYFLQQFDFDDRGKQYITFINRYFYNDSRGKELGISYEDEQTGPLTINVGTCNFNDKEARIGVNLRYPVTFDFSNGLKVIENQLTNSNISIDLKSHAKPHYVNEDHHLVKTLQKVYERHTGEEAKLLSTGGGTYARSLQAGVAFGPLFPGRLEVAHQKDEFIEIDDLLKAAAIYAEAIYELAK